MPDKLIDSLNLAHYKYDPVKNIFLLCDENSVFTIKELIRILSILEEKNIACEVDKDSNIVVL